jgi:MoaA/NifB/PqqE/SkfB family radical SAM enzyme
VSEPRGQVEIQLGQLCNNRCVFCVSGQLSELAMARQIDAEPAIRELREARLRGASKVTLLGGEPTIQRSFLDVLAAAKALGYSEIVIFTNGVMAFRERFVDRVLALGDFTWRFSVQGATEAHHDAVTRRPGSFERIVAGMELLRERGQTITANMCITTDNVESLPHYPQLVERYGIEQLHLDQIRPNDAGERDDPYMFEIMPRYSAQAPYLRRMLEGFDAAFDVNVGNFPYCLLVDHAHRIHHDGELTWTVAATTHELTAAFDKYEVKRSDKTHPEGCVGCVFRARCNGLFGKYQELHGDGEVRAVSWEALRAQDGGRHWLVLLLEPALAHLLSKPPLPPWSLTHVEREERQGSVTLRYAGPDGGPGPRLVIGRRGTLGVVHGSTDLFDFAVASGLELDPIRTAELAAAVFGDLVVQTGEPVAQRLDARALTATGLALRKLGRYVNALALFAEREGWAFGVEPTGQGFAVHIGAEAGAAATVRLDAPQTPGARIGVSYAFPEGGATDEGRALLTSALQSLRM